MHTGLNFFTEIVRSGYRCNHGLLERQPGRHDYGPCHYVPVFRKGADFSKLTASDIMTEGELYCRDIEKLQDTNPFMEHK